MQSQRDDDRSLIHRVLDVLHAFTPERPEMSLTSISRHTDLPLATVHRLVGELVHWGALERGEDGCYRLSVKIWQLGAATPGVDELSRAAMPSLSDLYQLTGQRVGLSILDGVDEVVIASIDGCITPFPKEPRRQRAYLTGGGLVLLAHADWQLQEQVVASLSSGSGAADRSGQKALRRHLADVRLRSVAVCRTHGSSRMLIAAGVRDSSSCVVAAASVLAAPDADLSCLAAALRSVTNRISVKLGAPNGVPKHLPFPILPLPKRHAASSSGSDVSAVTVST